MATFKIAELPPETKIAHKSQNKWRRKNWERTLKEHNEDIEKLIEKINLLDMWSNGLQHIPSAKTLIPEIFADAYISIHFVGYGLYKYAHMCLRSELETALRLVYFSTHPVEFEWWSQGNEWYREQLNYPDVWGKGYMYFQQLENMKRFENECDENKKLFARKNVGIRGLYKTLSRFIHSGAGHFQTEINRFLPKYNLDEFLRWQRSYGKVQTYIHIILVLGFADDFRTMNISQRNEILKTGINVYYREIVKKILNL